MMQMIQQCVSDIRMLMHRMQNVIGFGRTSTAVNDSGPIRMAQAFLGAGQAKDNAPIVQHYGFASNPPVGADLVYSAINGNRTVMAIIGTNHQSYGIRNMGNGAVALYDMFGNTVVLSAAGIKLHSPIAYSWDVNGYGQKITSNGGGAYTIDNYTTGATVTTNNHSINPPETP